MNFIIEKLNNYKYDVCKEADCFITFMCETIKSGNYDVEFNNDYYEVQFLYSILDKDQIKRIKKFIKVFKIVLTKINDVETVLIPNSLYKEYIKESMEIDLRQDFV
jgi:hypothetical protein